MASQNIKAGVKRRKHGASAESCAGRARSPSLKAVQCTKINIGTTEQGREQDSCWATKFLGNVQPVITIDIEKELVKHVLAMEEWMLGSLCLSWQKPTVLIIRSTRKI